MPRQVARDTAIQNLGEKSQPEKQIQKSLAYSVRLLDTDQESTDLEELLGLRDRENNRKLSVSENERGKNE